MAKQDLVVKLLLDSGAFGNNLREAERKAKQFSDNMKSAGKTAGDLGKEVGISAGALGKMSSAMLGVGGVVAAVGAFKSVMETTQTTAKEFHSTLDGFKNVFDEIQRSIARLDFSKLQNIWKIFKEGKTASLSKTDSVVGGVGYDFLIDYYKQQLKELEVKYRDTTSAKGKSDIANQAKELVGKIYEYTDNRERSVYQAFIDAMKANNTDIDKSRSITSSLEQMILASENLNSGAYKQEQEEWKKIADKIENLRVGIRKEDNKLSPAAIRMKFELEDLIKDYQDLMFRNVLYDMNIEELGEKVAQIQEVLNNKTAASEVDLQVKGWTNAASPVRASGGKTVSTPEFKNPLSKSYLREMITFMEQFVEEQTPFSQAWYEAKDSLDAYNDELKELIALEESYEDKVEEVMIAEIGSVAQIQKNIEVLEELTNNLNMESIGWETAATMLAHYRKELEKVMQKQKEFNQQFEKDEDSQTKKMDAFNEKLENRKAVLSSISTVMGGMSDILLAYEEEMSEKTAGVLSGISSMFSSAIQGAMSFIQVQQACATATGVTQVAAMPFPYNLMLIGTVVGTLASVFANIKQMANAAGKFAEGGIVGGTSYSGDKLFAMVNSGEMILNKRQQGNLANMLGGGGQVEFHISGDSLVGVLNNKRNKTNLTR